MLGVFYIQSKKIYKFGNKPVRQLVKLLDQRKRAIRILVMRSHKGDEISDPKGKSELFHEVFFLIYIAPCVQIGRR